MGATHTRGGFAAGAAKKTTGFQLVKAHPSQLQAPRVPPSNGAAPPQEVCGCRDYNQARFTHNPILAYSLQPDAPRFLSRTPATGGLDLWVMGWQASEGYDNPFVPRDSATPIRVPVVRDT